MRRKNEKGGISRENRSMKRRFKGIQNASTNYFLTKNKKWKGHKIKPCL